MSIPPLTDTSSTLKLFKTQQSEQKVQEENNPSQDSTKAAAAEALSDTVQLSEAALKRIEESKALDEKQAEETALALKSQLKDERSLSLGMTKEPENSGVER